MIQDQAKTWLLVTLIIPTFSNDVSDAVANFGAHRFGSRLEGDRLFRVFDEELFSLEADGPRAVREWYLLDAKGRQRPFPILDITLSPSR